VLGDPTADSTPLRGASGRLVVTEAGEAALVVSGLDPAPEDRIYEIWVIEDNRPRPAGLFRGERTRDVVRLTERVPEGAVVAVTLEREEGVQAPTSAPLFTANA
jgi:hypothetical protein